MSKLIARIRQEPALVVGFLGSLIALATSFGFNLSPDQIGGVMAFVSAGLAFVTRPQVSTVPPPTCTARGRQPTACRGP